MSAPVLERVTFSVSRAADFLEQRALVSQTGQPPQRFGDVVLKELLDNALDAAETSKVAPGIEITVSRGEAVQRVTVADNGTGIPPGVVGRILDFATLTSDKALYRSPCRGAQGNALKTIVGIPFALGVGEPVVIEARGTRHVITVGLDPAGNADVRHEREDCARRDGTAVTVPLPPSLPVSGLRWGRQYALVNPHASFTVAEHGQDGAPVVREIYKAAVQDGWRKPAPGDPTSPWWYDAAALGKLAASLAAAGDDRPLGAFAAEFRGLTGTAKRKRITAAVPGVRRVSDLAARPGAAAVLLEAMRAESAAPPAAILGQVPVAHLEAVLDDLYGVERFWYRHAGVVADGVPWHLEVAIAETASAGAVVYATNYAPSFSDPLGGTQLRTAEMSVYGAGSFLARCDAEPGYPNDHRRAAVVHITCAAPVFTDKGKTHLAVPPEVAEAFARVLWQAGKELYREARSAERAGRSAIAAQEREQRAARRARLTKKEAVFAVIPEAIRLQCGGSDLPFSAHSLFYKIRPLFLGLLPGVTLASSYCEQTLIPAYEREHGPISGMYREPRGELHEPHGGRAVPLGTREVSAYIPPKWAFDKILVVEKAGLWPVLQAARIADRYDMAVVTSEGFAAEACRTLLADLGARDVTIFVLHDADHSGYNIARTLAEATVRMPGHHIEMIDLGLTVDDAAGMDMETEIYTRDKALPSRLIPHLTASESEWFTGTECGWDGRGEARQWECRRVELNAFTSPGLISYIEDGLRAHSADAKVIPPRPVLRKELRDSREDAVARLVGDIITELAGSPAIVREAQRIARRRDRSAVSRGSVRARLDGHRELSWRHMVADEAASRVRASDVDFRRLVAGLLKERLDQLLTEPGTGDAPC